MKQATGVYRRLLQAPVDEGVMPEDPVFEPMNGSSGTTTTGKQYKPPTSSLDSSMALTILVLLTAIFFMGFFSIYIRRLAQEESTDIRRRRNPSQPSSSSPELHNNRKGKGVDPSTVEALPLVTYGEQAKQLITDCPICLTEFEEKEIVKLIPHCKHVFHPHCIDTWLSAHVSCPLCRSTQFFKKVDDEVRLDMKQVENSNGTSEILGRSMADSAETWSVGTPLGLRRTCSCTNLGLGDHAVLQRSISF